MASSCQSYFKLKTTKFPSYQNNSAILQQFLVPIFLLIQIHSFYFLFISPSIVETELIIEEFQLLFSLKNSTTSNMNKTDKRNVSIDSYSSQQNSIDDKPNKQSSELLKMIAEVRASKKRVKRSSTSISGDKLTGIKSMRYCNGSKKDAVSQSKMNRREEKKLTIDPRLDQQQANKQNCRMLFGHNKFPQIKGCISHKYPQFMLCRESRVIVQHSKVSHDEMKKIKSLSIRNHVKSQKIHSQLIKKCQSLQLKNKHYFNNKKGVLAERVNQKEKKTSLNKMMAVSSYLKLKANEDRQTKQLKILKKYDRENVAFDYISKLQKAQTDIQGNQRQLYVHNLIQQHSSRSFNSKFQTKHANKQDNKLIEQLTEKAIIQVKKHQFFRHPPEQERIVYLKLREKIKSDFYQKKVETEHVDRLRNWEKSYSLKQKEKINKKQIQFNIKSTYEYLRNQVPKNMLHMKSIKSNNIMDRPANKLIIK